MKREIVSGSYVFVFVFVFKNVCKYYDNNTISRLNR